MMAPSLTKFIGKRVTPTHTFMPSLIIYLPQKTASLKTLITGAIKIYNPDFVEKGKTHLTKDHHYKSKNSHSSSPPLALISLPYIQGTIDNISKILSTKNIKTLFKPHKTLK